MGREYAAQELNLEALRDMLEEEAILAQPFSPNDTSPEYERLQRQLVWLVLRMDMKVLEDLRSGTLQAFGVRLPLRPSSASTPIPPGLWYLMSFNLDDCSAAGPQWSYRDVRVINIRSMGAPERREIDRGLAIVAAKLEAEAMAAPPPTEQIVGGPNSPSPEKDDVVAVEESQQSPMPETEGTASDTNINLATREDHREPPRGARAPWRRRSKSIPEPPGPADKRW
jgi:hypothetical protein